MEHRPYAQNCKVFSESTIHICIFWNVRVLTCLMPRLTAPVSSVFDHRSADDRNAHWGGVSPGDLGDLGRSTSRIWLSLICFDATNGTKGIATRNKDATSSSRHRYYCSSKKLLGTPYKLVP